MIDTNSHIITNDHQQRDHYQSFVHNFCVYIHIHIIKYILYIIDLFCFYPQLRYLFLILCKICPLPIMITIHNMDEYLIKKKRILD